MRRILECGSVEQLMDAVRSVRLSERDLVAALNQSSAVCEFGPPDARGTELVDFILDRAVTTAATRGGSDSVYQAMLSAYAQTGRPDGAKRAFACIDKLTAADVGAALIAAAASRDHAWAKQLWAMAVEAGLLRPPLSASLHEADEGEEDGVEGEEDDGGDPREYLCRHYLAALVRANRVKDLGAAAGSVVREHGVPLSTDTMAALLSSAPTVRMLQALYTLLLAPLVAGVSGLRAAEAADLAEMYGRFQWCLLAKGDPVGCVDAYGEGKGAGLASLSMHCAATEAHFVLLDGVVQAREKGGRPEVAGGEEATEATEATEPAAFLVAGAADALQRAIDSDAGDEWVRVADLTLRRLEEASTRRPVPAADAAG